MIKKGLKVKVLAGKDKKKEGEVIEIDRSNNRVKVQGINIVKKHVKTTKEKKVELFLKKVLFIFQILHLLTSKEKKKKLRLKNNDSKIKRTLFYKEIQPKS